MKPILMIHEVNDDTFKAPLEDYILTFDDGLYSQYLYIDKLKEIDTPKIFFISSGIVASDDTKQSSEDICCVRAHKYFFETDDPKHYMNWEQINELNSLSGHNCFIGAHSFKHPRLEEMSLKDKIDTTRTDTKSMIDSFKSNLGYMPCMFAFPYNYRDKLYETRLLKNNIFDFYDSRRVDIEDLI
jgi:peptidoglycan/xylan/chitin deacetylase (PgdA/CDA1 family)